jgi:hypothetical protein
MYLKAISRNNSYDPSSQRPRLPIISILSEENQYVTIPKTIRESVPRVSDAFFPTAKVESVAKEFPRVASASNDGFGSTKGFSAVTVGVVIAMFL